MVNHTVVKILNCPNTSHNLPRVYFFPAQNKPFSPLDGVLGNRVQSFFIGKSIEQLMFDNCIAVLQSGS